MNRELPIDQIQRTRRIDAIDLARGLALVAMAVYHFTWDLEFFGYIAPATTSVGGWKLFARCIASSFLFLAGVSLFLAHGRSIRWPGFLRRLAMVAGAATAISLATWAAVPQAFIFFGILHQIALASLIGLLFLRPPALLTLAVAAAVIAAPLYLRAEAFDHPALWWLGLAPVNPRSNDYVPVFPWFGAVLAGIGVAKLAAGAGLLPRLGGIETPRLARPLLFTGRHSLAVYLIHQPVLIACIWLFSQIVPPSPQSREPHFLAACQTSCMQERDQEFCTRYCGCMLDALDQENLVESVFAAAEDPALRDKVAELSGICMADTESGILEGESQ
jgi:uncharacterized membrane protein